MNIADIKIESLEWALMILGYFWISFGYFFGKGPAYMYANERCIKNPLYAKGCFRKRKKSILDVLSNLKGIYLCQIIALYLVVGTFFYIGINIGLETKLYLWIEDVLLICYKILFVFWILVFIYYTHCYDKAFSYSENTRGIWMPFQYFVHNKYESWAHEGYSSRCKVSMEIVNNILVMGLVNKKYRKIAQFSTDGGEKYEFYVKKQKRCIELFEIIQVDELKDTYEEMFDLVFEHFWHENNFQKYENQEINMIACVCVKKKNELLEELASSLKGISYKKGRGRILAFIYPKIENRAWLYILGARRGFSRVKLFYWAKKEFLDILDINNH